MAVGSRPRRPRQPRPPCARGGGQGGTDRSGQADPTGCGTGRRFGRCSRRPPLGGADRPPTRRVARGRRPLLCGRRPCPVGGIGEVVDPLPHEDRTFTLLVPPFGMDTAAVYKAWDELDSGRQGRAERESDNDLEAAAVALEPRLAPVEGRACRREWSAPAARGQWLDLVRRGLAEWRDRGREREPELVGARFRTGACWRRSRPHPATTRWTLGPDRRAADYLPAARRCQRVAFNIFLCFFLRMRFRRFSISDPMSPGHASRTTVTSATRAISFARHVGAAPRSHSATGPLEESTSGRVKRNRAPPPFAR